MLKDITLGQYFPGDTVAHRLDPRTKILLVTLYIIALFCAKNLLSYALLAAVLTACVRISRVGLRALVRGQYARGIGRVCMDQLMLDVTDIDGVEVGDEAVFIGRQGDRVIYAEEVAQSAGTITNELLSRLGARVEGRTFREETPGV